MLKREAWNEALDDPPKVVFTAEEARRGYAMRNGTKHYCCYGMYCDAGHTSDCQYAAGVAPHDEPDGECQYCRGAEFPGWKRGVRCPACSGTDGVNAHSEVKP